MGCPLPRRRPADARALVDSHDLGPAGAQRRAVPGMRRSGQRRHRGALVTRTLIIGVDPGATTGICALEFKNGDLYRYDTIARQCPHTGAVEMITRILDEYRRERYETLLAVEQLVVGPRAGKSAT